ncbi:MAG: HlyD family secretion protein [Candidatus Omnitrophica bacterium]|jgi:membrane fusion protein (multidrug efflux system)|nr:HlyD family secretion protein [Candidatus Omnitrophota bacterium]
MSIQNTKKGKIIILLIVLALLGAVSLAFYLISNLNFVDTDDSYIAGRVHSIASKVPGTVAFVYANDNQAVKKDQALLDIDPVDYKLQVNSAMAAFEAEAARLSDSLSRIRSARISLLQAAKDKQRADSLFKEKVLPKEKYEKSVTAYKLAIEQFKAAQDNKLLEEALVKQKQTAFKTAQVNLGYTKIYSPSQGYIANKAVETGNQIQAGQPLMAVVALDDIWVVANYKETQLKNVKPGQKVKIKVDTYPGKVFTGKVDSIMPGTGAAFSLFPPENALGNYVKVVQRIPVKIVFDKTSDAGHILRIGMSCTSSIIAKDE